MEIRRLARDGKRWIIGQNQKSLASSRRRNVEEGMMYVRFHGIKLKLD